MKNINIKYQIAAGVILIICGTLALLSDYIKEKRDVVFSEMNLALSNMTKEEIVTPEEILDSEDTITEEENNNVFVEENKEENNNTYEDYLGIINIPKINLYRGFYDKNSKLNNVKFNLYVLPESNYPDIKNGNLIIAGHSGNYNNSYFANLYQLEVNDEIIIKYNNMSYTYKIVNIYYERKTGVVRIFRDKEKNNLTLITCTKDDKNYQTIYISELIDVQ